MRSSTALLLACSQVACPAPANGLDGSISGRFSLEFDRTEATKVECLLQIDYVVDRPLGEEVPCRIEIDMGGLNLHDGSSIEGKEFEEHVEILRLALSGGRFPPVASGWIHLDDLALKAGEMLIGGFGVTFEGGRDLFGTFDSALVELPPIRTCH